MATMASPPAESVLLDEKPAKVAETTNSEPRENGTVVNGHTSPKPTDSETKEDETSPAQTESRKSDSALPQNHNQDAFVSNQTVSTGEDESKISEVAKTSGSTVPEESEVAPEEPKQAAGADLDTEMADAPAEKPAPADEPKPEALVVEDKPAEPSAASEATEAKQTTAQSAPTPTAEKDDVEMSEIAVPVDPASSADALDSTQDTSLSDVPPVTPAEESNIQASIAVSSQASAPKTEPDSSDASQAAKLARAREDDGEDEPLAKRTKVEETKDSVQVKPLLGVQPMDVDSPGKASTGLKGNTKSLADPSLDDEPLSFFQNRELRKLLALVKKTRAGGHFKQSVEIGWPALWPDYKAKVDRPMDISTMEKKLRAEGDVAPYAHMREFKEDVELIYVNSVTFNGATHDITAAAKSLRDDLLGRLGKTPAAEPPKQEKKESVKHHPTRHTEPRAAPAQPAPTQTPRRPSKATAPSAAEKPVESPAFAIPPNNNGVPLIRRDSTKTADDRPKRPVNPPKNKDITYEPKKKRKVAPEIKFCEEVLTELKKAKYNEFSQAFMFPVDPVAMNIPHYHKVVKKPMDIQTMTHKLKDGEYGSAKEFEKDFNLIISNCRTFNGEASPYTQSALKLESIFKQEWSKKDEWVTKHTPAASVNAAAATSPTAKDESEDEDGAEPEPEADPASLTSPLLEGLIVRLKEEQDKLDAQMTAVKPDYNAITVAETMTTLLRKQIVEERMRLASQAEQVKPAKKPAKKKGGGGGGKKAAGGATATAGAKKGGNKKAAPKVRKLSPEEKDVVVTGIGDLEGNQLEKAIDIIKKDTGQGENDSGELELDIESLSDEALNKLYDIITKAFPNMRVEKEKPVADLPVPLEQPQVGSKTKSATKPKKNKPMSKLEQERRIQQLNELRAQATRQGSGSQEPMDSIEGNGASLLSDPAPQQDSEDEESSEEE
ncbi:hypothetical protein GQ53DRAFT_516532 [Thozetella sp. PMI_491]|nr:hypothetical protein GQ53DRAFT_516532 [Thozetella sp. PMI_491]